MTIENDIKIISARLGTLIAASAVAEESEDLFDLPVKDDEGLGKLESLLESKENKTRLVSMHIKISIYLAHASDNQSCIVKQIGKSRRTEHKGRHK